MRLKIGRGRTSSEIAGGRALKPPQGRRERKRYAVTYALNAHHGAPKARPRFRNRRNTCQTARPRPKRRSSAPPPSHRRTTPTLQSRSASRRRRLRRRPALRIKCGRRACRWAKPMSSRRHLLPGPPARRRADRPAARTRSCSPPSLEHRDNTQRHHRCPPKRHLRMRPHRWR